MAQWNGTSPQSTSLHKRVCLTIGYSNVNSSFWQKNKADGACVMLLGNKMDMEDGGERRLTTMQGQKLAEVMKTSGHFLFHVFMFCLTIIYLFLSVNVVMFVRQEYQAEFFECSAKSGRNIQEAMTHLAR